MRSPVPVGVALGTLLLGLGACGGGGGGGSGTAAGEESDSSAPTASGFTLGGTFAAVSGTQVDGDVNDPGAPRIPNDTLATAQPISNPATVGGYGNVPGAGSPGASFDAGDVRDVYRVVLAAGQTVHLFLAADPLAADLDLHLLEADGTQVAVSDGSGPTEELVAPASGEYWIEVVVFAGASNYVLSVGRGIATGTHLEPEFVPGEVIVRFRDARIGPASGAPAAARARALGLAHAAGQGNEALLACSSLAERDHAFATLGLRHLIPKDPRMRSRPGIERMRRDTRVLAKALRRRADVVSADLNYVRRPASSPTDEFYPLQWHYPQIDLPQAWDNVAAASGVTVAIVDTGVALAHPDLTGQLVAGYDFIQDPAVSLDGDGCDPDPSDPGDAGLPGASTYHGTHVAGTLAARTSLQPGGDDRGVAGVAWNARLMPLRVLGRGGGTDFDILQAIRYAARLPNACGVLPAEPARIVNLSLGGPGASQTFQDGIREVRMAGVTLVGAAGNFASDHPFYPAAYDGVIGVGAVDLQRALAPYSNFGPNVDLVAPGGDLGADRNGDGYPDGVVSTLVDDASGSLNFVYGFAHGTSMAAPHVAGVLALMLGVNSALSPFDLDALLDAGSLTRALGSPDRFGNGLVDAFAAVSAAYAAEGGAPPVNDPMLRVDPPSLHFDPLAAEATVWLSNGGGDAQPLAVEAVSVETDDGASWLAVARDAVGADGLGRYQVRVDRAAVSGEGIYTGVVRFDSNRNDVDVAVSMQVGAAGGDANAGRHFVVLLDPETFESRHALSLEPHEGRYRYRFEDIPAGEYLIVAGTDSDNDFLICDPGEACGVYPTREQPLRVHVSGDRSGLDFVTGFAARLSSAGATSSPGGYARPRSGRSVAR